MALRERHLEDDSIPEGWTSVSLRRILIKRLFEEYMAWLEDRPGKYRIGYSIEVASHFYCFSDPNVAFEFKMRFL